MSELVTDRVPARHLTPDVLAGKESRQAVQVRRFYVPDEREPGKLRRVEVRHEVVVRLLPDEVVVEG